MIFAFALLPLLVVAWIAADIVSDQTGDHLYWAVMAASGLTVLLMSILGRFPIHWSAVFVVLAVVPPVAPVVVCHACAHLLLRATHDRPDDDPWSLISQFMGRRWLRAGNVASMMCVVLLYYWWDTVDHARLTFTEVVVASPLSLMIDAFAPFTKAVFFALALWYGVQLVRTGRIVLSLREEPDASVGETPASDTDH